ncbi:MAG: hypothetical protein GWN01_05390, partial [Nitrosopumilaceae archaeon]|nr:hypothetical protein [Nitrosopumilaceae archaeon]NIU86779.1 hypothetical protein [Nitrosopumilaceae archaeon]NIX60979.1 hypothetical protein [Nitrosopumilaceae archaeon]
ILDNEGDPVVARVYLPGAKLVSTHLFNRMKESLEKMGKNTGNSNVYEFYKGQFLAFREAMLPEVYGK